MLSISTANFTLCPTGKKKYSLTLAEFGDNDLAKSINETEIPQHASAQKCCGVQKILQNYTSDKQISISPRGTEWFPQHQDEK